MTGLTIVVIAAVIVIAVVLILKSRASSKTSPIEKTAQELKKDAPTADSGPAPADEYKHILDSLLSLNILIRTDANLAVGILTKLETIIDDLRVVIPQMMVRYPSETLTYEIKKIGQSHLFKTVKEFMDLSLESRENQLEIFTKTIDSLHEVSERSRTIVEKNETAEFKTMANFLSTKFS